jgi:hypothetical protein
MMTWDSWKKSFDVWENETAKFLEVWMKSPMILGPSGSMLSQAMKAKSAYDKALSHLWSGIGLPTKRDQERILHALNQLESKLLDLEERLEDQSRKP